MKRHLLCIAVLALGALAFSACSKNNRQEEEKASAILLRNQTIQSAFMKEGMKYTIWLPGGSQPTQSYPFLYLLHGAGDDQNAWTEKGNAISLIREYVAGGGMDMVVVMPDAKLTFYSGDWESYFYNELLPEVESKYKCNGKRAVAGLSMGGYGTLHHALTHPDKFTYAYAMSPAVMGDMSSDIRAGKIYPPFTIEMGTGDAVVDNGAAKSLAQSMIAAGISCEVIERVGTHDWAFWQACLPKALQKAGESFK